MHVISLKKLRDFWKLHPPAEQPLKSWYKLASRATWTSPHDVKQDYRSADQIGDRRMVFNIGGNNYRLVVRFTFKYGRAMIKWVGTHAEYDKIDAEKV